MGLLDGLFTNANTGGGNALGVPVTIAADGLFDDADTKDAGAVLVTVPTGRTITGRRRFTGMQAEQTWQNLGPGDLVLRHNDSGVAAADRIVIPTGADYVVRAGKSVSLVDDVAASRTRVALQDADRAAYSDRAAKIDTYTRAALIALGAWEDGKVYTCSGAYTAGDYGRGAKYIGKAGSATVDNIDVIASSGSSHLKRENYGQDLSLKYLPVPFDGNTDATAAWSAILNYCARHHVACKVPQNAPKFVISDTIDILNHGGIGGPTGVDAYVGGGALLGGYSKSPNGSSIAASIRFEWRGANDRPAFRVRSEGFLIQGVSVYADSGYTLLSAADYYELRAISVVMRGIFINGINAGVVRRGIRIGVAADSNQDIPLLDDIAIGGNVDAGIEILGGQAYMTRIGSYSFSRGIGGDGVVRGVGVMIAEQSCSVFIERYAFLGAVAIWKASGGAEAFVSVKHVDNERCKRFFYDNHANSGAPGAGSIGSPVQLELNRCWGENYITAPAELPNGEVIPAGDAGFIVFGHQGGLLTNTSVSPGPHKVRAPANAPVTMINCIWSNTDPVDRVLVAGASADQFGGTFLRGCRGWTDDGAAVVAIPDRSGPENADFTTVISGATTTTRIPFSKAEMLPPSAWATVRAASGSPAVGIRADVTDVTRYDVELTLTAAPGSGNSVRAHVHLSPPIAADIVVPSFEYTTAQIQRFTPNGGGFRGSAGSHWIAALITPFAAATGQQQWLASAFSYSEAGWRLYISEGGVVTLDMGGTNIGLFTIAAPYTRSYFVWGRYDATANRVRAGVGVTSGDGNGDLFVAASAATPSLPLVANASRPMALLGGSTSPSNTFANASLLRELRCGLGAPSDADILAMMRGAKSGSLPAMGGVTNTHRYVPNGAATLNNLLNPTNTADNVTTVSGTLTTRESGFIASWTYL